jgi:hypothetical protein
MTEEDLDKLIVDERLLPHAKPLLLCGIRLVEALDGLYLSDMTPDAKSIAYMAVAAGAMEWHDNARGYLLRKTI